MPPARGVAGGALSCAAGGVALLGLLRRSGLAGGRRRLEELRAEAANPALLNAELDAHDAVPAPNDGGRDDADAVDAQRHQLALRHALGAHLGAPARDVEHGADAAAVRPADLRRPVGLPPLAGRAQIRVGSPQRTDVAFGVARHSLSLRLSGPFVPVPLAVTMVLRLTLGVAAGDEHIGGGN